MLTLALLLESQHVRGNGDDEEIENRKSSDWKLPFFAEDKHIVELAPKAPINVYCSRITIWYLSGTESERWLKFISHKLRLLQS